MAEFIEEADSHFIFFLQSYLVARGLARVHKQDVLAIRYATAGKELVIVRYS